MGSGPMSQTLGQHSVSIGQRFVFAGNGLMYQRPRLWPNVGTTSWALAGAVYHHYIRKLTRGKFHEFSVRASYVWGCSFQHVKLSLKSLHWVVIRLRKYLNMAILLTLLTCGGSIMSGMLLEIPIIWLYIAWIYGCWDVVRKIFKASICIQYVFHQVVLSFVLK